LEGDQNMNAYAKARYYIGTEKGAEQLKQAARDAVESADGHPVGGLEFNVNYFPRLNLFSANPNKRSQGGEEYVTLVSVERYSSKEEVGTYIDLNSFIESCDDITTYIIKLAKDKLLKNNEQTFVDIIDLDNWWISLNYLDLDLDKDLPIELQKSLSEQFEKLAAKICESIHEQKVKLCIMEVMHKIEAHENEEGCEDYDDEECEEE